MARFGVLESLARRIDSASHSPGGVQVLRDLFRPIGTAEWLVVPSGFAPGLGGNVTIRTSCSADSELSIPVRCCSNAEEPAPRIRSVVGAPGPRDGSLTRLLRLR
jgi:hypothetical protein